MRGHLLIRWVILLAYSLLVGQFIWLTFGPATSPDYWVGAGCAMTGPDPEARHLYLRHQLYLGARPYHSWIQALSRGRLRIYVNGKLVAERSPDGTMGALLVDPTNLLQRGSNIIAIAAEQYSPRRPAMVAFDAAYTLSDGEHRIAAGPSWRCSDKFERGKDWWFMSAFDDQHWSVASLIDGTFRGSLKYPPRSVTEPSFGHWITAADFDQPSSFIRREFDIDGRPRQGWLRLTATAMNRLAVNGTVLDIHEEVAGVSKPLAPEGRIYDITPFLRQGTNVVDIALEAKAQGARVLCDLEADDDAGKRYRIGSDNEWQCSADSGGEWLTQRSTHSPGWKQCHVESGYLGVLPWDAMKSFVAASMPFEIAIARIAARIGVIAGVLLVSWVICCIATRLMTLAWHGSGLARAGGVVFLSLAPSTILLFLVWLASLDPRVGWQDVYRPGWLVIATCLVPIQWLALALAGMLQRRAALRQGNANELASNVGAAQPSSTRIVNSRLVAGAWWPVAAISVIVLAGFVVRLPGVANRPLGADEVNMYRCVQGFYDRGFPSFVVHKDLPPQYISTSELVYVGGILAELFFDDDRYVIRFPSVCWGTFTIVLIYVIGRRMFHPVVGLVAAALYAFAPIPITMANFGRYPSQLQFFALLTTYFFWRTLHGTSRLNCRYLLFTTLSAIAMFLSWEPSLLLAPGMIVAALWMRRGQLQAILSEKWVWMAMGAVSVALILQIAHRDFKQAQRMNLGTGASDVALKPMWRYAHFDIVHFLKATSWGGSDALPMAGLIGALMITVRHAFRNSVIYVLLVLLITSVLISLTLPVDADRYSYFLTPLLILAASAAAVAAARSVRRMVRHDAPNACTWHARMIARIAVLVLLLAAMELNEATVEWDGTLASLNPTAPSTRYLGGPGSFLSQNVEPGDIVLGTQPYLLDHQLNRASGGSKQLDQESALWLQTRLHLQAVMDDVRPLPLNRRDGTAMVANLESLTTLFAKSKRIWFVAEKGHFNRLNLDEVDAFLRQHMDVVFEDSEAVVLLRDARHRPAALRNRDENTLLEAQTDYLRKDASTTLPRQPVNQSAAGFTSYPLRTLERDVGGIEHQEQP